MSEYLIQGETLSALADEVRTLSGATDELTTEEMKTNLNTANGVIDNQADLLEQAIAALEGKAAGGSADPVLQEKTATPSTSSQTITPDSGYDGLSQVTVNAMPTATQATPSISVSSAGLITASSTQSAGYVSAGTKSATKQLTTQAAKTVTPTTSNQTAVESGRYTTGAITVKGDANLKADNITQGISIFGVAGANPYEKNATTTEVNTQASKLDELKTILAGKAAGGSGGAVETCTVYLVASLNYQCTAKFYYMKNGVLQIEEILSGSGALERTFEADKNTVLCVSNLALETGGLSGQSANGGTLIYGASVASCTVLLESDQVQIYL